MPPDLAALGGSAHQHLGGYYGMVKRLDEALGRLLDALKSLGLLENTIVLFTSDHGCHFKTRNGEYKRSCHESSIRVPDRAQRAGLRRRRAACASWSAWSTCRRRCSTRPACPCPPAMQGRSILPLLRRSEADWPDEVFVQISESQVGRAVRTQRWKYGVTAPGRDGWEETGSDRYVEDFLYDLEADPYELDNLVGLEPSAPSPRSARTADHPHGRRRRAAPTIEDAPTRPGGQRAATIAEVRQRYNEQKA